MTNTPFTPKSYEGEREITWCPGCGDYGIIAAVKQSLAQLQIPPHQAFFISGIGCGSKLPDYLKANGYLGLHGRTLPIAQGVKIANHDLKVIITVGDGDSFGIGAGYIIKGEYEIAKDQEIKYKPGDQLNVTGGFDLCNSSHFHVYVILLIFGILVLTCWNQLSTFKIKLIMRLQSISSLAIGTALMVLSGCSSSKKPAGGTGDNSQTSVDWPGTYYGVTPCADCEGIETRLILMKDKKYSLERKYLGKSEKSSNSQGDFSWDKSGTYLGNRSCYFCSNS